MKNFIMKALYFFQQKTQLKIFEKLSKEHRKRKIN